MDDRWRVVPGVGPLSGRVGENRSAQLVVRVEIRPAHALIHHFGHRHRRIGPADVHADVDEGDDDAGVLAHRTMALGTEARVGEDLRDRVLRRGRRLGFIGTAQCLDIIERVIIGNVLQRVGDALDQIFLPDRGHGPGVASGGLSRRFGVGSHGSPAKREHAVGEIINSIIRGGCLVPGPARRPGAVLRPVRKSR